MEKPPLETGFKLYEIPAHCLTIDPAIYITSGIKNGENILIDFWQTGVTLSDYGLKQINKIINENGWIKRNVSKSQINLTCKTNERDEYLKNIFHVLINRKCFSPPPNKTQLESMMGPLFKAVEVGG